MTLWEHWTYLMTETGLGTTLPMLGLIIIGIYTIRKATK